MNRERWGATGVSPFFTERARTRAPQILSYAAVGGAALLLAPSGELVMVTGTVSGLDLDKIAKLATAVVCGSFKNGSACIHVTPVTAGWALCAISTEIDPRLIVERLRRASSVMALALLDGGAPRSSGGGSSGAPAEIAMTIRLPAN